MNQRELGYMALGASLGARSEPRTVRQETTVHEHRAPTDESVRLLAEMEEKARARVLDVIPIEGNAVSGKIVYERSAYTMQLSATAIVNLNGKRIEASASVEEFLDDPRQKLVMDLHKALAEKIAAEILIPALRDIPRRAS